MLRNLAVRMFSRASTTRVEGTLFKKRYQSEPFLAVWGFLEGRNAKSPEERMKREWSQLKELYPAGVRVPEPVDLDESNLELYTVHIPSISLRAHVHDATGNRMQKTVAVIDALDVLNNIHQRGRTHGDPYLKNFIVDEHRRVYASDLEHERNGIDGRVNDLRIFAADAIFNCVPQGITEQSLLKTISPIRNDLPRYPFSATERLFYRVRFGVSDAFFDQL